ncbi:MAG TPA: flagellar basal body rod C-terminal domain-containing protein [Acidimicrobiales bacterium]|nr:flagellar basal body rod C-terminal domain-containing protein [Acidimicrobiales bacterium]
MSLFGAFDISASGVNAAQLWINTSAGNIANANDVTSTSSAAYREQTPVFVPGVSLPDGTGSGVAVAGVAEGSPTGIVESDPQSPMADAQGLVRVPDVSIAHELVNLVQAQNDFQANTAAMERAKTAYQAALTLGS